MENESLPKELNAIEIHKKALSYYEISEQYGFKFLIEIKTIRDKKLYLELGYDSFEEYTLSNFNYSKRTINERIQTAEEWGEDYERALARFGKEKTKHLGFMPESDRKDVIENGIPTSNGIKSVDDATTREIATYKKQLKEKEQQIQQQQNKITELSNKKSEVVEVPVEVVPNDYEFLKQQSQRSNEKLEDLNRQYNALQKAYNDLSQSQSKQLENGKKYEELEKEIARLKGQMTEEQERIASLKETSKFFKQANEMLDMVAPLVFSDTYKRVANESMVAEKTRDLVARVEKWCKEMNRIIEQNETIEGEVIYD